MDDRTINSYRNIAIIVLIFSINISFCKSAIADSSKSLSYKIGKLIFSIPISYHFDLYEKYSKWPNENKENLSVDHLSITTIFPNFEGYDLGTNDSKFSEIGSIDKIKIRLSNNHRYSNQFLHDKYIKMSGVSVEKPIYGLKKFNRIYSGSNDIDTSIYFDLHKRNIFIRCDMKKAIINKYCVAYKTYKSEVELEYRFSIKHLKNWRSIDIKVNNLLDKFLINYMY